ncbi:MAG TPA: hypothetical protein VHP30_04345 [Ignavibacteriales bacterium]|nr:hypothetical protein [Ignavibacteriales bacterium]
MIKNLVIGLILLSGAAATRQLDKNNAKDFSALVDEMRICFFLGVDDEKELDKLEYLINKNFGKEESKYPPKILAYAGGLDALRAKHTYNPFSKFSHTLSGLKKLDKAVGTNPNNLEIRFLRFAVLDNVPGVFGISGERQKDLYKVCSLLLKKDYSELTKGVQQIIAEYMLESKRLDDKQRKSLRELFPEIVP